MITGNQIGKAFISFNALINGLRNGIHSLHAFLIASS